MKDRIGEAVVRGQLPHRGEGVPGRDPGEEQHVAILEQIRPIEGQLTNRPAIQDAPQRAAADDRGGPCAAGDSQRLPVYPIPLRQGEDDAHAPQGDTIDLAVMFADEAGRFVRVSIGAQAPDEKTLPPHLRFVADVPPGWPEGDRDDLLHEPGPVSGSCRWATMRWRNTL